VILAQTIAQSSSSSSAAGGAAIFVFALIYLAVIVFLIAAQWKVYAKAGQPGWAAIVPIYNIWVMLKIVGREGWWLLLLLIPCVNIVVICIVYLDLAKSFGKSAGYGWGLILLPFVFMPMLGFGDARYVGPAALTGGGTGYGQPYGGQPGYPPQQGYQQPGQPGQWGQQPPQQGGQQGGWPQQ
jgi:hypothetical protein